MLVLRGTRRPDQLPLDLIRFPSPPQLLTPECLIACKYASILSTFSPDYPLKERCLLPCIAPCPKMVSRVFGYLNDSGNGFS